MTNVQPATTKSNAIVRDPCPKCGAAMLIVGIAPGQPRHHLRTFECPKCKQFEGRIVKDM
jgi:predicted RNA-binding Zn-ribbon protein involved in translation (DUF1610 family)